MSDELVVRDVSSDVSSLVLEAQLPGSADEVFLYFTEPAKLTTWWPQEAEIESKTGGDYELKWPAMNWTLRGRYLEFERGERLRFTWNWDHEPDLPERVVDIQFADAGAGACQLRIFHGTYDESARDQEDRASHDQGWRHFLGQLAVVLRGAG